MRFSRFLPICGALSVLAFLCGCTYLIPENPSSPRYNTVVGERHRPLLNGNGGQPAPDEDAPRAARPAPAPQSYMAAPVAPVAEAPIQNDYVYHNAPAPQFPPVDAATKARADAMMRQSPQENMNVAENAFSGVPPRPTMSGDDSDAARLNRSRVQMEQDRANADAARDQLSRDAAAEPSLLNGTSGTVPAPAPVSVSPLPPANIPANGPRSQNGSPSGLPSTNALTGYAPQPPLQTASIPPAPPAGQWQQDPSFSPPVPLGAAPAPASMPAAPNATLAGGLEPIILRPPGSMAQTPSASGTTSFQARRTQLRTAAAGDAYLPTSRYTR